MCSGNRRSCRISSRSITRGSMNRDNPSGVHRASPHDPLDVGGRAAPPHASNRSPSPASRRESARATLAYESSRARGPGAGAAGSRARARRALARAPPPGPGHSPAQPGGAGSGTPCSSPRARRTRGSGRAGARWPPRRAPTARRSRRPADPALDALGEGKRSGEWMSMAGLP